MELGRWPLVDGGQYLPSPHEATPSPLSLLSGDLDFGIFQFFTRLCWWWDLNPNPYTPGLGISSKFFSLESHQDLSRLEHHRTLHFFGGRFTMVPTPPRGAPPTLDEPSDRPPPLLRVTPPSPPFLAGLSFGMSLKKWRHAGFLFLLLGATRASGSPVTDTQGTLDDYFAMRNIVETSNACELPGVSIKYGPFLECMWRAVEKGFVDRDKASFVAEGLKSGFMAGVDVTQLRGHRWFKNYPPALEARRAVTKANNKRVGAFKTLALGVWSASLGSLVRATFGATAIAPLNAVPKPMEKNEVRPCTDHTRTGFNAATSLEFLGHSLDTYNEVAHFLKSDYFMHVSDVDAAFPMLPFHWSLWPFLMFRFFASDDTEVMTLYMHVCGDFGTRGMPGVFQIFFSDVVVNMARAENVLTLPMPIYVDDMGLMRAKLRLAGHGASHRKL